MLFARATSISNSSRLRSRSGASFPPFVPQFMQSAPLLSQGKFVIGTSTTKSKSQSIRPFRSRVVRPSGVRTWTTQPQPARQSRSTPESKHCARTYARAKEAHEKISPGCMTARYFGSKPTASQG
eukprot:scaffold125159_cov27-Tisochrysis_lutea.AAC.3